MAHSLSRKKRIRQNVKRRARNRWRMRGVRDAIKDFNELVVHNAEVEKVQQKLNVLHKMLDQVAATPAMHKNTAARYKSRLAAKLNALKAENAQAA